MLPETNATLLELTEPGGSEDYDQVAGAGTPVWTGVEGCYVVQERLKQTGAERADELIRTYLVVDHARALQAVDDGMVTFSFEGAEQTRKIRRVEQHRIAGTGRLWLRDA